MVELWKGEGASWKKLVHALEGTLLTTAQN